MKHFRYILILVLVLFISGCGSDDNDDAPFDWKELSDGSTAITYQDRILLTFTDVELESFDANVTMQLGFFTFDKDNIVIHPEGTGDIRTNYEITANGNLRVTISVENAPPTNGIRLFFAKDATDRFWGFGEQYSYMDFAGMEVPIWVQEQGVGRYEEPPLRFLGTLLDTYFPMPYFVDPAKGFGFLVENSEYMLFDLGKTQPDKWSVEVWNGQDVSFLVFPGPSAESVITQLTAEVGRPQVAPPDWAFSGVWLAAQGGRTEVEQRLQTALDADIPVTALWVQDWLGKRQIYGNNWGVKYRWVLDEQLYPDFSGMITNFRAQGVRFLGYFNNFIVSEYEHYDTAVQNGYTVKTDSGQPYLFPVIGFDGSVLDVTNPAAVDWFQGFARQAVAYGMSGWMCDFGEWLPFDAQLYNGEGQRYHNLYATEWHRINREVLEEAYPDNNYVIFTRSGFTGEHKTAQIVWAGDQEADWSETDGLPTVVTSGLTMGLSGIPFFTHDIAGFSGGPRGKELFQRWTELGAFSPFMRTHDGLRKTDNHHFDTDSETLAHFTRFARIHRALLPYFKHLAAEAIATGLPIIRHTVLVDPQWSDAYEAHWQWMLGRDMLFAPVVHEGEVTVEVYFPEGEWEHLLTGDVIQGRQEMNISAPIGTPAVYVRAGQLENVVTEVRLNRLR